MGLHGYRLRDGTGTQWACGWATQWDWFTMELVHNGPALMWATQFDWYTNDGTSTQWAWYTMGLQVGYTIGLVHDGTSTQWACAEVGYTVGLVHNGTITQWACDDVGLHNSTGTQTMELVHNGPAWVGYAMGLVYNGPAGRLHNRTGTRWN